VSWQTVTSPIPQSPIHQFANSLFRSMSVVFAAVIVGAAVVWSVRLIARELAAARDERVRARSLQIVSLFAPALAVVRDDPRALLVWQPLAQRTRQLFPAEFRAIEATATTPFPFSAELIQAAHARWTSDWLAWEHTHDAEYKLKAASIEEELTASGGSPLLRAKLDAVEREKLDRYQRRYEEYVRVAKALQALTA